MPFLEELKRRNVIRVGIAYVVTSWLLLQVTDVLLNNFEAPAWFFRTFLLVLVIGFPLALLLAWAFELTPDGIRKEKDVAPDQSITRETGRRMDRHIIIALTLALGLFAIDKFLLDPARDREIAEAAAEQARNEAPDSTFLENSIAVLPFADLSQAGDQQYFSDGIAEELLNALVRVDGLRVASRTSSFVFRGDDQNLRDIADALQVSLILEGSVRRAGNRVRITAQLIDAHSDRHLWSENYDRDLDDVLAIQDEIANAIVTSMKQELGLDVHAEQVAIASNTQNMDAYDLYLKGRSIILARADIGQAAELLEQAVAIDPGFAKAWEVLGAAYFLAPSWGFDVGEDPYGRAVAASEHALALDDSLALAVAVIGNIGQITGSLSYEEALDYDRRAMEADPHNATVRLWAALHWVDLGFFDKAIELLQSCLEIDPAYGNCKRHLANAYLSIGNEERAIELFQQGSEEGFNGNDAAFVPAILRSQGRAAAGYVAGTLTSVPGFPVGDLLDILQYPDRDHTAARHRFRTRVNEFRWSNQSNKPLVGAYFGYFDLGKQDVDDGLYWIWGPDMADFRQSPQFRQLVMNVGLLDYWRENGFPPRCRPLGDTDVECD